VGTGYLQWTTLNKHNKDIGVANEKVLVVDDSKENREFIVENILRPNNFQPLEASDGVEGLESIRANTPDLILLDYQMPRLNGIGVLEAMRRENINIPVVLMTLHGSEDVAVEVFRMGVRDYLKKPYKAPEMLRAIETCLSETRLRREKEALTSRLLNANRELHSRAKELETLLRIGKSVSSLLDPAQLLGRVLDAAVEITHAEQGSLLLVESNQLVVRAIKRRGEAQARFVAEISRDPFAEQAAKTGRPFAPPSHELTRLRERSQGMRNIPMALLYVPMALSNRVIGVIGVESLTLPRIFSQHDTDLLNMLSDYASIALENARNFQQRVEAQEREKQNIRGAFERYVSPSVVQQVLDRPEEMRLGGERREISVLFADVRGFSTFSELADPEFVVDFLNEYFTLATDVIMARDGTLDKFLGDGVMAIFNAPNHQADHLQRAVASALALQQGASVISSKHKDHLMFGIGIAMGDAVIGNVGTTRAMNYTAVGDVVNVAKRLQERAEPGQILVDERVVHMLNGTAEAERIGEITFKNRQKPVIVYQLNNLF
jgi:class 3 adenylate cyclase/FixJ family two-component response regulator